MNVDCYDSIYIVGNLFMTYVISKYFQFFYSERQVTRVFEIAAFGAYFIVINLAYFLIKVPLFIMLLNLPFLFLLTFLYKGSLRKNILSIAIIYISLICTETAVVVFTRYMNFTVNISLEYNSVFHHLIIRIALYVLVLTAHSFKYAKREIPIPRTYWFSLFFIPFATIALLITVFKAENIPNILFVTSIYCFFIINSMVFCLYDCITKLVLDQMNRQALEEQHKYYEHQLGLMETALNDTKRFKHDLKNKLYPIYDCARNDNKEVLLNHISKLIEVCDSTKEYAHSGNASIDSILNFKLGQAERININVSLELLIPPDISVHPLDISVILGNLVDNSIEAVKTTTSERWISVKLKYTKGRFIITISNSFDGVIYKKEGRLISRKEDLTEHGIGLASVQRVLKKYDGSIHFSYDHTSFKVKVLMYL